MPDPAVPHRVTEPHRVPEPGPRAPEALGDAKRRLEWGVGSEGPYTYHWAAPAARRRPTFRFLPNLLLFPYAIALFLITWLPASQAGKVTGVVAYIAHRLDPRIPFSVGYPLLEFLANIALFVPLGILLSWGWPRLSGWFVCFIGFATTLTIECVQWGIPSRFPAISDIVANTTGTVIGVCIVALLSAALRPRRSVLGR